MTATLYRLRDADGTLLYVGISTTAMRRLSEHAASKPWWTEVASIDVEHFPTRRDAATAERVAIRAELPLHNIADSPRHPRPAACHQMPAEDLGPSLSEEIDELQRQPLERLGMPG